MRIIIILFFSNLLFASENILNYTIDYYKDINKKENIYTIKNKDFIEKTANTNFGHTDKPIWLKIKVTTKKSDYYILDYGKSIVDYLDVYFIKENTLVKQYHTGINRENSTKAIKTNSFSFPFYLDKKEELIIYLRINSSKIISLPLIIQNKKDFEAKTFFAYIFASIFFTTLIVIFFINLSTYFITKKDIFKYYSYYLIGAILFWFSYTGFNTCFVFQEIPYFNTIFFYLSIFIYFSFYALFSIKLLKNSYNLKKIYSTITFQTFYILSFLSFLNIFFIFQINIISVYINFLLFLSVNVILFLILIVSIINLIKNRKKSLIFTLIILIKTIMFLIFLSNIRLSFFDINEMTSFLQITIILESIGMSLLLPYNLNFYEKRNQQLKVLHKKQKRILLENYELSRFENILNMIVHQWKQPLNTLNAISLSIETKYIKNELTQDFLFNKLNDIEKQTEYMTETMDNYLNYFSTNKKLHDFNIYHTLIESLNLLSSILSRHNIKYNIYCKNKDITFFGNKKEFIQVLLILISNTIEAYQKNKSNIKKINFYIYKDKQNVPIFSIKDNAGGIKLDSKEDIFKANISSKSKQNSGFGLYIAKFILENMNKKIKYFHIKNGTKFKIIG